MKLARRLGLALGGAAAGALLGASAYAAEPITLHALMEDISETKIIEAMLPEFEKETGIKVEFQKLVYPDMHDKLVTQLTSNESQYNVLEVDFLWASEFPDAGWLADLKPFVEKTNFDLKPFFPAMLDLVGMRKGTLSMIPMYNYSMGLIYRTDLMNDAKIKDAYKAKTGKDLALPKTLEEYVELSKFMNANAGVAGAAMQGQRGDPNSMEFSNYLFSSGGNYVDKDGKVTLNSPEGLKALQLYADNMKNGSQKGSNNANLDDTLKVMCDGKSFSMVTYWNLFASLNDPKGCPNVAGKVAITVMPGGHGEGGAWGWAIPKNESPELQEAAWKFISWVQGAKVAKARAIAGHSPVRSDTFTDPDVIAAQPHFKAAADVVASSVPFPVFTYTAQYEDVLGRQLSLTSSGEAKAEDALKAAADGLDELMKKAAK
jgi:ABC-type glycerol-3-phosphate transport system substrate-binding protein